MVENTNRPMIRFKGFTDAWGQRRLLDMAEISSGGTPSRDIDDYWNGDIPWATTAEVNYSLIVETSEHISEAGLNNSSAKVMPIGTILMAMYGQGKTRGQVAMLGIESATNQANANIIVNQGISNAFIYHQLVKNYESIRSSANEGGQANLSLGIVKELPIAFTENIGEQTAIGNFFHTLDTSLTLHKRKLVKLKELKRGYLQLMFPQSGERLPRLRFSGFSDDWQVRRLGDVGEIITGSIPPTSDIENYSDDGMMWVTPTDINGITISTTAKRLSDKGQQIARIVPLGSILVSCIASIGKNTMAMSSASFNQQINAVVPNESNDPYFLLTQSEMWSTYMKSNTALTTMQIVNKSEFSKISVLLPTSKQEQIAIGNFFHKLDERITSQAQYMEQLKQLKAAYLQRMFV